MWHKTEWQPINQSIVGPDLTQTMDWMDRRHLYRQPLPSTRWHCYDTSAKTTVMQINRVSSEKDSPLDLHFCLFGAKNEQWIHHGTDSHLQADLFSVMLHCSTGPIILCVASLYSLQGLTLNHSCLLIILLSYINAEKRKTVLIGDFPLWICTVNHCIITFSWQCFPWKIMSQVVSKNKYRYLWTVIQEVSTL